MIRQIRKLPALLLTLLTFFCISGKSQDIDYFAIFDHLDPGKVPTGILYDKAFPLSDVLLFDGSDSTVTLANDQWELMYNELVRAHFDATSIPTFSALDEIFTGFKENQKAPVCMVNMDYNKIKLNAFDDHLLEFRDNQLYDVPHPSEPPYETNRLFTV
ncbi:MAG: hypothetical protein K9H26_10640, partial [Prolixibacteraceae bacterium]|nr:hypothetical protein [Prolixibacteraceae bacterium]